MSLIGESGVERNRCNRRICISQRAVFTAAAISVVRWVWHYVFGFASKPLAEDGFYENPRRPGTIRPGYVPFVLLTAEYARLSP
jgi:hypothetical protein